MSCMYPPPDLIPQLLRPLSTIPSILLPSSLVPALRAESRRHGRTAMRAVPLAPNLSTGHRSGRIRRRGRRRSRRRGILVADGLVVVRDVGLDAPAALDAEDDEQDPCDELAHAADGDAGDAAVEHARVGARVGGAVGAVVARRAADAARGGGPGADEPAARDDHDEGGDEEGDGPPLGELLLARGDGDDGRGGHGGRGVRVGGWLLVHFVGHFVVVLGGFVGERGRWSKW